MAWMLRRTSWIVLLLLMVAMEGLATPAWADHGRPAEASARDASAVPLATAAEAISSGGTLWPVLLVAAALLIISIGSRRSGVGLVAGLLLLFTFEGAIHSVHHIGDPKGQSRCAVESASSHLGGILADPIAVEVFDIALGTVSRPAPAVPSQPLRAARQRAPPLVV